MPEFGNNHRGWRSPTVGAEGCSSDKRVLRADVTDVGEVRGEEKKGPDKLRLAKPLLSKRSAELSPSSVGSPYKKRARVAAKQGTPPVYDRLSGKKNSWSRADLYGCSGSEKNVGERKGG